MANYQNQIEIDNNLDWATLHEIIRAKYGLNDLSLKYIDDENEEIDINTQNEFENAFALAELTDSKLKFIIRDKSGKKLDEIFMNIQKRKFEPKPVIPVFAEKPKEEQQLINFDNIFNLSTIIDSKIENVVIERNAVSTNTDINNNNINVLNNENNPPEWFTNALKKLKSEILNDIEDKLKPLYEKFEELKLEKTLNNSETRCDASQVISVETLLKLVNELDEAKLLKDVLKVKDIEEELTELNAFNAKFIRDCNIPDGTRFEINTKFKKSWLLQNSGRLPWSKVKLINITGSIYCSNKAVEIPNVDVDELIEAEVELVAPEKPGIYVSEWVLSYQNYSFGPRIWCAIEVVDSNSDNNKEENDEIAKLTTVDTTAVSVIAPLPEETQLVPLPSPTPSAFNRKLSTSSRLDERLKELVDLSDDENEFVIIPDCLDLTKKWEPTTATEDNASADISIESADFNFVRSEYQASEQQQQQQQQNQSDHINSMSTMALINELLLIPKRDGKQAEETKLQNLMTFSTSVNDEANDSIEHINIDQTDTLNDTIENDDEKNLLLFSNDYSNNLNILTNNSNNNNAVAIATNVEQQQIDRLLEISANAGNIMPSAPEPSPSASLNSQQQQVRFSYINPNQYLDPNEQLISMGFANRTLNRKLLEKHNFNVERVIEEILSKQDNDWHSSRH